MKGYCGLAACLLPEAPVHSTLVDGGWDLQRVAPLRVRPSQIRQTEADVSS
jgi:hypothetical protein